MAQPSLNPPPGFDALSVDEQIDYVHALWQKIVTNPAAIAIPDWHLDTLETRQAEYRNTPEEGKPWDEVREEILRKLDQT